MKVIHFAGVVPAWAVSTAGLFTNSTTKSVESRPRQIGHGPPRPCLGTLVAFPALSAAQGQQRAEGVDDPVRARAGSQDGSHNFGSPSHRNSCRASIKRKPGAADFAAAISPRTSHPAPPVKIHFDQVISAAQETRDVVAEANALLRKSYLTLYGSKQPTAGLVMTTRAATISHRDSHVIAGLAHLHGAEAHAMLGQARDCADAIGAAEGHFAAVNAHDPAIVLFCRAITRASRAPARCSFTSQAIPSRRSKTPDS